MHRTVSFLKRVARAARFAATDDRIPRPLRWLVGLGLLPWPGPVDEIVLVLAAVPLATIYREPLADAWRRAALAPGLVEGDEAREHDALEP